MTRPDSSPSRRSSLVAQLAALGEADSLQTALFHQAAAARYGLNVTDMKALSILVREGSKTAGELMAKLGVTSGAVTGVVDRLQRAGMARRETDPNDRRRAIISANDAALAAGENPYLSIGAAFAQLYGQYSTAELEFLVRHVEAVIDVTRRETAALRDSDSR